MTRPASFARILAFAACAATLAAGLLSATARAQQSPGQQAEGCPRLISGAPARVIRASLKPDELRLAFVGHATFEIETPMGLRAATDYNDFVKPARLPDIITMNKAHSTHFTDNPDPGIKHVLRGWAPAGGAVEHDVTIGDMRIRNVSTNIRSWRGTESGGNSIFVFEAAQLCVAHLGHLHHELTVEHLAQLGRIDVALVPVDGGLTLSKEAMIEVVRSIQPMIVIPMHFFGRGTLQQFLDLAGERFPVEFSDNPSITLSRDRLPKRTTVLVLPGR